MSTLITAFEPFGDNKRNVSLDTLQALPSQIGIKEVLPVSFARAPEALTKAIARHRPDLLVMLGQSGQGDNIRLERYAHNLMDSPNPDNDGCVQDEAVISPNAPIAYASPLPLKQVWQSCRQKGLPVVMSNTAGLYVCNRLYFEALRKRMPAVFIHIPIGFDASQASEIITQIILALQQ